MAGPAVPWRRAEDELELALIEHGEDSEGVIDPRAAWAAFRAFAQIPFSGLVPASTPRADGIIVHWGWYDFETFPYSVGFGRQWRVRGTGRDLEPETWWIGLELSLRDSPDLAVLADERQTSTGLRCEPVGLLRELALNEMEEYPQVQAILAARPILSCLRFCDDMNSDVP